MLVPKLRFKRENGTDYPEWERGHLGDISEKVDRRASDNSTAPIMMISQGNGFIYQAEKYSRDNAGQSLSKYTLLKKGEMAYNHGASKLKPYGVAYTLIEENEARIPFVYHSFSLRKGVSSYWNYALNTTKMDRQLKKMVSSGARMDGLLNISFDTYMQTCISIPHIEEQQKIADFLSNVDEVIAQSEAEVANLQQQKKAAMQKIFSQEVRFKREDGTSYPEWTKQKLSAVSSRVTRKNKGNITDIPLTIASLYGLVDQREYFKKKIASRNMEGYYLLHNGEFAYNKSYSKGFDFGAIKRLDRYDCGALSTLYICFAVNNKVDSDFMTHYFDSQKWNKEVSIRCAEGARNHGLLNISTNDFFDIDMVLPTDLEEQQKIADFLATYDEAISCAKQELDKWKELKKGLLQQMFA